MAHDARSHEPPRLDTTTAAHVAAVMHALSTASRVAILGRLRQGAAGVGTIAADVGMEQSAVSHQLRVLREHGLVTSERHGRAMVYDLHDDHVVELIDQAVHHTRHVQLGLAGRTQAAAGAARRPI